MRVIPLSLFVCAIGLAMSSCLRHVSADTGSPQMHVNEVHQGRGIACNVNGHLGPASFPLADIGKRGVPQLDSDEVKLVAAIKRYVRSDYLRFAIVHFEFVVFNVETTPLCQIYAAFFVLNGAGCNEYYTPAGDNMDSTFAAPTCIYPSRPWMRGDSGKSNVYFDWNRAQH